jgi:hypothetical protein
MVISVSGSCAQIGSSGTKEKEMKIAGEEEFTK